MVRAWVWGRGSGETCGTLGSTPSDVIVRDSIPRFFIFLRTPTKFGILPCCQAAAAELAGAGAATELAGKLGPGMVSGQLFLSPENNCMSITSN